VPRSLEWDVVGNSSTRTDLHDCFEQTKSQMTDGNQELHGTTSIEREAIAWFTRMNGKPSKRDAEDFEAWVSRSSEHEVAYRRIADLWSNLGSPASALSRKHDGELAGPLERIDELRRRRVGKIGPAIAVALAMCVTATWVWLEKPHFLEDMEADFATPRGERREVTLEDGSRVLMDADTAVDISLTAAERRVHLLRGTAFFSVSHTGAPFIVEAGNGEARVLGTEFDVSMKQEQVTVTLAKGSVKVDVEDQQQEVMLRPSESVDYGAGGLGLVRPAVLDEEMAWHQGRFVFNNARLSDVMAQIERYRSGRIVILGSNLGSMRVSGSIALDNTAEALASIQSTVGFRVTNVGKLTVIGP
jgi:transmembrane sensor